MRSHQKLSDIISRFHR